MDLFIGFFAAPVALLEKMTRGADDAPSAPLVAFVCCSWLSFVRLDQTKEAC